MNAAINDDLSNCQARSKGSVSRLGRRVGLLTSLGARYVGDDPVKAAVLALRLVPRTVRRPLSRATVATTPRRFATVRAIAQWETGDRAAAASMIIESVHIVRRPVRRRLVRLALALGQPALARDVLRTLPAGDPQRDRLAALTGLAEGNLRGAVAQLDVVAGPSDGRRELKARQRLRARLSAELAAFDPDRRPRWSGPPRAMVPIPGRLLHLVTNSLPHASAGYTVRTHMIVRAQQRVGLDPHVATKLGFPVAQGVLIARDCDVVDGVPYVRLLPGGSLPVLADEQIDLHAKCAAALLEDLRPAVLHAASNHINGQVALALRDRYQLPVVYEVRGFLEDSWLSRQDNDAAKATDRYLLARELETYCMREADAVVTLGERMKEEIVARGVAADRITVAPNGVDASFLEPHPDPGSARKALGARPGDVVVGTLSTFFPHEGLDDLIRAVALLRSRGAGVRLALVGDGSERAILERLVAELDLGGVTSFIGRVPFADVRRYHAAIDIFAVPRTDDQVCHMVTPLKPIEAMATGRVVVASKVGGLTEIVEDGVTGALTPPENPSALADAIEPLLYDEALRQRLGSAARNWVARDRTWSRNAERYHSLYKSLGAA